MGVRLAHGTSCGRRPDRSCSATVLHRADLRRPGVEGDWCGRAVLLHMPACLPIGHVDGERLETVVPRARAESAHGVPHAPLVGEAPGRGWRCTCMDTIVVSQ